MRRLAVLLAALAVAGCGDDDVNQRARPIDSAAKPAETPTPEATSSADPTAPLDDAAPATTTTLTMGEGDRLAFSESVVGIEGGGVITVSARNASTTADHALAIKGGPAQLEGNVAGPGETSTVELDLPRGRYVYYCPIGDHEREGMKGRLVIR